jgi:hypothetical protein|tara:strand:+ start:223 stop:462 length:240 start_codon:yes stop_codon:yes gene_type:complete
MSYCVHGCTPAFRHGDVIALRGQQVEWAHHAPKIKTKVNSDASKSSQPSGKKLFPILKHMSKPMNHSEPHIDKETEKGE